MEKIYLNEYKKQLACALILTAFYSPNIIWAENEWKSEQQMQIERELAAIKENIAKRKQGFVEPAKAKKDSWKSEQQIKTEIELTKLKEQKLKELIKQEQVKPEQIKLEKIKDAWKSEDQKKTEKELLELKKQKNVIFNGTTYDLNSEKDWDLLKNLLPENDEALYNVQYKYENDHPGRRAKLLTEKNAIFIKLSPDQKKDLEIGTHQTRVILVIRKLLARENITKTEWDNAKKSCKMFEFDPNDIELELEKYIVDNIISKNEYDANKIDQYANIAHKKDVSLAEERIRNLLANSRDIRVLEKEQIVKEWKQARTAKWEALKIKNQKLKK